MTLFIEMNWARLPTANARTVRAVQPPREQCGGDAVAWAHPPDIRPNGDDLAGTVRDRYDVRFDGQHVLPP
ncbi:hypothetical protein ABZU75_31180 [Streptosporangium sp. NPDC005286]|uniref:hypothetical protein n=1 Tax=Streptosporangium sp. NPDC005286 TaxID=3154463 RepID=UPI0033A94C61